MRSGGVRRPVVAVCRSRFGVTWSTGASVQGGLIRLWSTGPNVPGGLVGAFVGAFNARRGGLYWGIYLGNPRRNEFWTICRGGVRMSSYRLWRFLHPPRHDEGIPPLLAGETRQVASTKSRLYCTVRALEGFLQVVPSKIGRCHLSCLSVCYMKTL